MRCASRRGIGNPAGPCVALHKNRFRAAALSAAVLALAPTGCATLQVGAQGGESGAPLQVRLEGLQFLTLGTPRMLAVTQMRSHGWECRDEAATEQHMPCTRPGLSQSGVAVVLTFAGEALDAVRTPLPIDMDPRAQFDSLFEKGRRMYPQAFVERTDVVSVARFLPGDGSSIELRHFIGADSMEQIHFGPARLPPDEPRSLKLSKR